MPTCPTACFPFQPELARTKLVTPPFMVVAGASCGRPCVCVTAHIVSARGPPSFAACERGYLRSKKLADDRHSWPIRGSVCRVEELPDGLHGAYGAFACAHVPSQ